MKQIVVHMSDDDVKAIENLAKTHGVSFQQEIIQAIKNHVSSSQKTVPLKQ